MSDLTEMGQEAIAAVSRGVAEGAPLVKYQLLASAFYEALRHELQKARCHQAQRLACRNPSVPPRRGCEHQPCAGLAQTQEGR
jgi:hypothetical protein